MICVSLISPSSFFQEFLYKYYKRFLKNLNLTAFRGTVISPFIIIKMSSVQKYPVIVETNNAVAIIKIP